MPARAGAVLLALALAGGAAGRLWGPAQGPVAQTGGTSSSSGSGSSGNSGGGSSGNSGSGDGTSGNSGSDTSTGGDGSSGSGAGGPDDGSSGLSGSGTGGGSPDDGSSGLSGSGDGDGGTDGGGGTTGTTGGGGTGTTPGTTAGGGTVTTVPGTTASTAPVAIPQPSIPSPIPPNRLTDGRPIACGPGFLVGIRCFDVGEADGTEGVRVPDGIGGFVIVPIVVIPVANVDTGASTSASSNVDLRIGVDESTGEVVRVERRTDPRRQRGFATLAILLLSVIAAASAATYLRVRKLGSP